MSIGLPLFQRLGLKGYLATSANFLDTANHLTSADLSTFQSAGWDVGNHTLSHVGATDSDPSSVAHREISIMQRRLQALGMKAHDVFVWPGNSGINSPNDAGDVCAVYNRMSYMSSERSAYGGRRWYPHQSVQPNKSATDVTWWTQIPHDWQNLNGYAIYTNGADTGAAHIAEIQEAITYRGVIWPYTHSIQNDASVGIHTGINAMINIAEFCADEIAAGRLICMTPTEYYDWVKAADDANKVSLQWLS